MSQRPSAGRGSWWALTVQEPAALALDALRSERLRSGLAIGGIVYAMQMKLDRRNHAILLTEIARIKAGGAIEDVPPEARAVAEELTGWPYEQCWGRNPLGAGTEAKGRPVRA